MKRHDRFWCSWMHRWLLFLRRIGDLYLFEDFGDARFLLTAEEVGRLTVSPEP